MFYGWYIVGASCLIMLYTNGATFFGFTAVFEPIATEFGWSYTQISLAASLRGAEVGLLVPIAGMLMDRWGPRRLVFGGIILSGLGLVLLSRISTLAMFYASFILITAGVSTTTTSLLITAVANWFRKKVGLAMGIAASGVAIGGLLTPLITIIIDTFGWRHAMFVLGVGMWAIPLPMALLLRHKPEQYGYLPDGEENRPAIENDLLTPEKSEALKVGIREALSSWSFWIISIGFLCQMMLIGAVVTHIMPYLGTIGIERSTSSLIAGILPFLTIIGRVGFGWLGDRFDKRAITALAFALTSLGSLILGYTAIGRTWVIPIFLVVFGIGWGGSVPMMSGTMIEYFGRERISAIVGFAGSVLMMGVMIGAPLAGWIFDKWGHYQPAWFFLAGLMGTATILFYVSLKKIPMVNARNIQIPHDSLITS